MYAQVITPGYRIGLEVAGQRYVYHSDMRSRVVYCAPEETGHVPGGRATETVRLAKEDLAQRVGVAVESISVTAVLGQEFPAEAFYCRQTKERSARDESPVIVAGETILLSAGGHGYEYHASGEQVIFCRQLP
jgi:hypothetical protein